MTDLHPLLQRLFQIHGIDSSNLTKIFEEINKDYKIFESKIASQENRDEYWAAVSHEIRTPLNSILGMGALLSETKLDEEQKNWLYIIQNSSEGLLEIINDVLDFSKIESGKFSLNNVPFNLFSVVEDVINMVAIRLRDKPVELVSKFPADNYILIGDANRVKQILINIIGNAIKFTSKGHIGITIDPYEISGDNANIRILIEDTGIGIPVDKLESIFGRFNQAEAATATKFGGTGLGLSISKKLAEMMHGNIRVESVYGEGSTFIINLQLPISSENNKNKVEETIPDFSNVKILIVEDYIHNQEVIRNYLTPTKAEMTMVNTSIKALEIINLTSKPFDIILVDYSLDYINGLELGKKIKLLPKYNDSILLMVTSYSDIKQISDKESLKNMGFDGLLLRPFYSWQLLNMLNILLDSKIGGQSLKFITKDNIKRYNNIEITTNEVNENLDFSKLKILIVEDVKVNQILLNSILSKYKCYVKNASNGVEALEIYNSESFDIIFMDCHMPEKNGFETTKEIRLYEDRNGKHTRIIALTADAMQGDREKCLAAGMDDYLTKPFKKESVIKLIDDYRISRKPSNIIW